MTTTLFKPYGLTIPPSAAVSGEFSYDPSTPATRTFTSGLGYDQHITNGLQATIGGVSVSASDYVVEIYNDALQLDKVTIKDEFIIMFSSGLSPPLSSELTVNGAARTSGLFTLTFVGDSSLYSDMSLPSSFNFGSFPSESGIFGDRPTGNLVTFSVVPEPSTQLLFTVGAFLLGAWAIRFRVKKRPDNGHISQSR